ncbi:MAG: PAS domain S-box protein, partial [Vicinamibacteria bacterium]|nr:PAS domain S-box protein [Vicinamibacteria bacterium]
MADETGDDPIELRAEVAESRAEIAQRQNQPTPFTSFGPDFPGIYYRARLDGRPIAFEGALDEITGYAANDFLGGRPRWDEIVYPADYPRWQLVSNSLAAGTAKRAEREYRIVHKNGEGRHVHEILRQIIDTNDRPEALEGLIFDISRHRQVDAALEAIHKSTTVTLGEAYFVTLLRELTAALGARWGLVGHLLAPHTDRVRTLAFLGNGQVLDNFEYSLAHTPCERVYAKGACYYPSNVAQRFPQDIQLTEMGVEAYLGVPLRNARGETIGALVVLHDQPMPESDLPPTMIEIFAGRAAAEIERLRADQALRESEARFRRITESVTDYVYNVVVSGGQIVATHHGPGCVAVTGYTETEFEADPYLWIKMVPADDRAAVEDLAQDLLQGGEPQPLVHRIIRKDGSLRVVCNTVVTHRDEAGRLLAYDGLIRDITERHQAEAASRASAARLSRIVDNITDAFYIHDSRGNILDVNENACRMLGYTRAELVGGHLSTIDAEEDRRLMPERMRRLLETGSLIYEGYHTHKNGARIPIEVCVKVVSREGDGMILSFVRDITERRRNAEALNASELRARNFIESSPMGIHLYALHENNRLVFLGANPAAVRLLGFDHAPLIGKTIEEAFPPL